jgi:hypothetical protein
LKNTYLVLFLIILVCTIYFLYSRNINPNEDERASLVIALGKFPMLSDQRSMKEYLTALDYTRFSGTDIRFQNVLQSVLNDNSNGSLYYFILAGIIKLTGLNLIWLRLFSIVIAGTNLFLIYTIAGKFQNQTFFQWTAVIQAAINPVFFGDAFLIRSYMLALLGVLLSIYYLLKIMGTEKPDRNNYIFYFLSVLLAIGNHYFTLAVLSAEFVFIFWKFRAFSWSLLRNGFMFLTLVAAGWFYLLYPVGWHNLSLFQKDIMQKSTLQNGYLFSIKNLLRVWMNAATNFIGFTTDILGKSRVVLKCLAVLFWIGIVFKLCKIAGSFRKEMLLILLIFSSFFYSVQSMITGSLSNFIPHYLFFMVPIFIWSMNTVVSWLIYPEVTERN